MKRALVIGASGLVGHHLLSALTARGAARRGTYSSWRRPGLIPLDTTDRSAVRRLVEAEAPDVVFVPAARANVELCEREPAATRAVNVGGFANVLSAAAAAGALTVAFSTDYVFGGADGPYDEAAPVAPLSEYGRQKLELERIAAEAGAPVLVLRTTVVYGWEPQGKNFVCGLVRALREGRPLRVPVDQIGSPTHAPNLAAAAVELAERGETGLLHASGPDVLSRYAFALAAADAFALDRSLIVPVETPELGQLAARPLRAGLLSRRAQSLLPFPLTGHAAGLASMAAAEPAPAVEAA